MAGIGEGEKMMDGQETTPIKGSGVEIIGDITQNGTSVVSSLQRP